MKKMRITTDDITAFRESLMDSLRGRVVLCVILGAAVVLGVKVPDRPEAIGFALGAVIFLVDIVVYRGRMSQGWSIYLVPIAFGVWALSKLIMSTDSRFYRQVTAVAWSTVSWSICCLASKLYVNGLKSKDIE